MFPGSSYIASLMMLLRFYNFLILSSIWLLLLLIITISGNRFLFSLHGTVQISLLVSVGFGALAVQHRSTALILGHATQFVIEVATGLLLLILKILRTPQVHYGILLLVDGPTFVIKNIVTEILINESSIVQRVIVALTS